MVCADEAHSGSRRVATISIADKVEAEDMLCDEIAKNLESLPEGQRVMRKLNSLLAQNTGVIASFSRALTEGLSAQQSDAKFNATPGASIQSIYNASVAG